MDGRPASRHSSLSPGKRTALHSWMSSDSHFVPAAGSTISKQRGGTGDAGNPTWRPPLSRPSLNLGVLGWGRPYGTALPDAAPWSASRLRPPIATFAAGAVTTTHHPHPDPAPPPDLFPPTAAGTAAAAAASAMGKRGSQGGNPPNNSVLGDMPTPWTSTAGGHSVEAGGGGVSRGSTPGAKKSLLGMVFRSGVFSTGAGAPAAPAAADRSDAASVPASSPRHYPDIRAHYHHLGTAPPSRAASEAGGGASHMSTPSRDFGSALYDRRQSYDYYCSGSMSSITTARALFAAGGRAPTTGQSPATTAVPGTPRMGSPERSPPRRTLSSGSLQGMGGLGQFMSLVLPPFEPPSGAVGGGRGSVTRPQSVQPLPPQQQHQDQQLSQEQPLSEQQPVAAKPEGSGEITAASARAALGRGAVASSIPASGGSSGGRPGGQPSPVPHTSAPGANAFAAGTSDITVPVATPHEAITKGVEDGQSSAAAGTVSLGAHTTSETALTAATPPLDLSSTATSVLLGVLIRRLIRAVFQWPVRVSVGAAAVAVLAWCLALAATIVAWFTAVSCTAQWVERSVRGLVRMQKRGSKMQIART